MSDLLEKCTICQAMVDEEDLFCANCGTEAPDRSRDEQNATRTSTHNFECGGCGASMSYDAKAQTLRCPFCGSDNLEQQADAKVLAPNYVVPFVSNREQAMAAMRKWMGSSFWRPNDLADTAVVTKMARVFVPYWVFQATTDTYWTADSSQTPFGARGDWYPLAGEHRGKYSGVLIGASGALTPNETANICPFNLATAVPPDQVNMDDAVVEQFRVQRKYARPLARQGLEEMERNACEQYVPGRSRNVKVNVRLSNLASEPVLLPVWIMAYTYKEKVFRFLVNGQSGKATGEGPTSWRKILLIIGIVLAVILCLLIVTGVVAGIANAGGPRPRKPHPLHPTPALPAELESTSQAIGPLDSFAILPSKQPQPFTYQQPSWPARKSSAIMRHRTTKTIEISARIASKRWSANWRLSSGCGSRSMPHDNETRHLAICCSTARRAWEKPRSRCASHGKSAAAFSSPAAPC